jgi:hypothetical protein
MLSEAFKKERAETVRDLARKANDPFIRHRLLELAAKYEDKPPRSATPLTPNSLQFKSQARDRSNRQRHSRERRSPRKWRKELERQSVRRYRNSAPAYAVSAGRRLGIVIQAANFRRPTYA